MLKGGSYDYVTIFYEGIRINTLCRIVNVTRGSTWNLFTPLLLISFLMLDCTPRCPYFPQPLWNSIVRIDISYFRFTTHLSLPFVGRGKVEILKLLSVVKSHECFETIENVSWRIFSSTLARSCDRKLKRRKKNEMIPSILSFTYVQFYSTRDDILCQRDDLKIILNWTTRDGGRKEKDIFV